MNHRYVQKNPYAELVDPMDFWESEEGLPQYSYSTIVDDTKVRTQYIRFCIENEYLHEDFEDDLLEFYVNNDENKDTRASERHDEESEVPFIAHSSKSTGIPEKNELFIPNTRTMDVKCDIGNNVLTKVSTIHETITTVTVCPRSGQVFTAVETKERPDLMTTNASKDNEKVQNCSIYPVLFTYTRIREYLESKMEMSFELFEENEEHTICMNSLMNRYLPSLSRQMRHEIYVRGYKRFSSTVWKKVMKAIESMGNKLSIPKSLNVFFPLCRSMLCYFGLTFPNGKGWFASFMAYSCLYQCGLRSGSICALKWDSVSFFRRFFFKKDPDEMREICLEVNNLKGTDKKKHYPVYLVGYENVGPEHEKYLLVNPDVLFWLNILLFEMDGITIEELLKEKHKGTNGSERYRSLAYTYLIPNGKSTIGDALKETPESLRKRTRSMSTLMNSHLREIGKFAGMSPRVLGMLKIHQSLRRGCVVESEAVIRRGMASENIRNRQGGWSSFSPVPRTVYDSSDASSRYHYANTKFNLMSSTLPTDRNEDIFKTYDSAGSDVFSYQNLLTMIQSSNDLRDCHLLAFPFPPNVYFEHNYDLVSDIIHGLMNDHIHKLDVRRTSLKTKLDNGLRQTIVLAIRELIGKDWSMDGSTSYMDEFPKCKQQFLSFLSGKRRDIMAKFIYDSCHWYCDISQSWRDRISILSSRLKMKNSMKDVDDARETMVTNRNHCEPKVKGSTKNIVRSVGNQKDSSTEEDTVDHDHISSRNMIVHPPILRYQDQEKRMVAHRCPNVDEMNEETFYTPNRKIVDIDSDRFEPHVREKRFRLSCKKDIASPTDNSDSEDLECKVFMKQIHKRRIDEEFDFEIHERDRLLREQRYVKSDLCKGKDSPNDSEIEKDEDTVDDLTVRDECVKVSDDGLKDAIDTLNKASFRDIVDWVTTMDKTVAYKSVASEGTHGKRQYTRWDILSFLLYKSSDYSNKIRRRANDQSYSQDLSEYIDRLSPQQQRDYDMAVKMHHKGEELSHPCKAALNRFRDRYPNYDMVYGWAEWAVVLYGEIRLEGLTFQQIKDALRNLKKREAAFVERKSARTHMYRIVPKPNETSITKTSSKHRRGSAYAAFTGIVGKPIFHEKHVTIEKSSHVISSIKRGHRGRTSSILPRQKKRSNVIDLCDSDEEEYECGDEYDETENVGTGHPSEEYEKSQGVNHDTEEEEEGGMEIGKSLQIGKYGMMYKNRNHNYKSTDAMDKSIIDQVDDETDSSDASSGDSICHNNKTSLKGKGMIQQVQNAILKLERCSFKQLMLWVQAVQHSHSLRTVTQWNIITYILFQDVELTDKVQRHATKHGYYKMLKPYLFRLTREERDNYNQAQDRWIKDARIPDTCKDELRDILATYPRLRDVYKWGELVVVQCVNIRKNGLSFQQIKDMLKSITK